MELKTTDLRINSWVKSNLHDLETEIFSILSHGKVRLGLNPLAMYDISEISGIKLTEEWLINFGFNKCENFAYINIESGLELLNIENKYFRAYYRSTTVKADMLNVHQLQNLYFALTGTELTHQKIN